MAVTLQMGYNWPTQIRWPGERSNVPRPWPKGVDPLDAANSTIPLGDKDIARFWAKVDQSAGPDGCWPWLGGCDRKGYGLFFAGGRKFRAARLALALAGQEPTGGQFACHHCDNPGCCNNLRCLFAGTPAENAADRDAKGRQARGRGHGWHTKPESRTTGPRNGTHTHPEARPVGERNGAARLSAKSVQAIRAGYQRGGSKRGLAREFGVSDGAVRRVLSGETWGHLAPALPHNMGGGR